MKSSDTSVPVDHEPILIDFFSGCGGTSAGFREAGFKIAAAVEFDPDAAATFATNFPEALMFLRDIRDVPVEDVANIASAARAGGRHVVFSACAPCQPFSRQRRGAGPNDARADLLLEVLRFVEGVLPDALFIENVPGMEHRSADLGPFRHVRERLVSLGYALTVSTIRSRDYGVPQTRIRLVVLASRHGSVAAPSPTHGPGRTQPYATVRDAIAHYPAITAGGTDASVNAHRAARLSSLNLQRIRATPEGGSHRDWPRELLVPCHRDRERSFTDAYGRLAWDALAPGLTTRCISYSNGRFGHPDQDRAISVREAAALQTFPRGFAFAGPIALLARQIGNAVPVALAAAFAGSLRNHLATEVALAT